MKLTSTLASAIIGMASLASAHMEMKDPAPLRSKYNDFTTNVDYSMTSPLTADGSNFPCKGYHSLMGTPQGKSVKTYQPGQSYKFTITGQTTHNGGSCQASLSYDKGKTFKVIHSYIGNCPTMGDSDWDFKVPDDAPAGDALFAWTWFNQVGNREMYMNCAVVTIGGSKKGRRTDLAVRASSLSDRPDMLVANVGPKGNGCTTLESKDTEFPDPGPDVTRKTPKGNTVAPKGSCGATGSDDSGDDEEEPSSSAEPSPSPTASAPAGKSPAPAAPSPTSMQTIVKPNNSPSPTPSPTPTPVTGEGAMEVGSPCDSEGQWNCVSGTQFQRCASGQWSALLSMSAGTACKAGKAENLAYA